MAHNKVYGFCESGCKVEVDPSGKVKPIEEGGTGATDAEQARENIGAASKEHKHSADDIGGGTIPIQNGGTGGSTAREAEYNICKDMGETTNAIADDTLIVAKRASTADATSGALTAKRASLFWTYIIGKIRSTFGFSTGGVLPISNGGTGATGAEAARTNIGAVNKSGDTMGGKLTVPYFAVKRPNHNYPSIEFYAADGVTQAAGVQPNLSSGKRQFVFYQWPSELDSATTRYYDGYALPETSGALTKNGNYKILTTKEAVTLAQGGTGATTARAAEYNICNDIKSATSSISDDEMIVVKRSSSSASATNGAFATKTASLLWAYVKKKQHIQTGTVNDVNSTGVTITFPEAFAGVPVVVACGGSESSSSVRVRDITKTGCRLVSAASNNDAVQWIAVYMS